ncbi:MFS transporter, DHA1 family, chloramphenicol resistance protein [Streptoalloteichus tenebrarius]|uniref:MFS transporter, DHA1 family, chloramphenicol resistance protein n=1 Tax=Streptoalloteichus tenebrarius (strain ATCC 17920 / DSM 40477 / JCM 4838 / CBS 697.72 / NBRC 16177 / NCIMB 11028 / NRRL B-12390 / A12253. 1 / ISP 5477) TaxID=1933 RepID=A0ABT1HNH9_STRSD|nr:Cmx/CmrA family chloramphenicol efflux MFS transporter [Streptoalloteichus tenebrarius]MCP2257053.1 MFS transporter, DHA1 family, chloramphenicol resistance protein [Streptoalloteichus tenebrarius]
MPFTLYLLGLAVFAQGTSEFMLSGLLPGIADDLGVSLATAGTLTSAFAAGMVVGAPLVAMLSLRWSPRGALLGFLVTFLLVHVLGALTPTFAVLLATRVVAALANAGFLAVALATATSMVDANAKGRATSVLLGGTTLACVAGVPAGAVLGQMWGWRSAFWAVALLSAPAVIAILFSVPRRPSDSPAAPSLRGELRALRSARLVVTLLLAALVNGATFCTFTYLAPLVTEVAGLGAAWVPVLLALFGVGSFAGVAISGRLADTHPVALLVSGGAALLVGWAAFALTAGSAGAAIVLMLVQSTLSFAVGSTLISQVLYAAAGAPTVAGGLATAALNVGAVLGPALGGLVLDAGLGYRSPLWVSAVLVALALVLAAAARGARARREAATVTAR